MSRSVWKHSFRREGRRGAADRGLTLWWVLLAGAVVPQLMAGGPRLEAQAPTARAPRDWVVDAAQNEIGMLQRSDTYLRYRMHLVDQKGDQIRDVIESKDGTVARLILRDGRALTAEEDAAERERLNDILASPSTYARHVKNDASGKKLASDLIRLMPDAMIYTYVPGQPPSRAEQRSDEVVMDYVPNPKWSPPTTASQALTGLQGRMWIDVKAHRMRRMDGLVFKPVNFGWGMLAHVYPGGKLELEQTDAGNGRWMYTRFTQEVSVRALLLKTLNVHTTLDAGSFQVMPVGLSFQEAVKLLLATPLPAR